MLLDNTCDECKRVIEKPYYYWREGAPLRVCLQCYNKLTLEK